MSRGLERAREAHAKSGDTFAVAQAEVVGQILKDLADEPAPAKYGVPRVTFRTEVTGGKTEAVYIKVEFPPTEQAARILTEVLPDALRLFLQKNQDYAGADGDNTSDELGSAGQYAELKRKMGKLKRALWDRLPMEFEQPDEILRDFFGHVLLALLFIKDKK